MKYNPLHINWDDRGKLIELMKFNDSDPFYPDCMDVKSIKQINLCVVNPGVVKAWHLHQKQVDFFCCVGGFGILGLHNGLEVSQRIALNSNYPEIIRIENGIWHGLSCHSTEPLLILEFLSELYNDGEDEQKMAWDAIEFNWGVHNK